MPHICFYFILDLLLFLVCCVASLLLGCSKNLKLLSIASTVILAGHVFPQRARSDIAGLQARLKSE